MTDEGAAVAATLKRSRRGSRAEKARATRAALFAAAIEIVGEYGYAESSIARITGRAGVAQGTYYNYFESRQDLLDQLLPAISTKLIDHIRQRVLAAGGPVERERARIAGFFEFLSDNPNLFKILSEGPVQAPKGFARHLEQATNSYRRAMQYELAQGNLRITDPDEIEVVTQMLLSAREYLSARYCFRDGEVVSPPDFVVDSYMKFMAEALFVSD